MSPCVFRELVHRRTSEQVAPFQFGREREEGRGIKACGIFGVLLFFFHKDSIKVSGLCSLESSVRWDLFLHTLFCFIFSVYSVSVTLCSARGTMTSKYSAICIDLGVESAARIFFSESLCLPC